MKVPQKFRDALHRDEQGLGGKRSPKEQQVQFLKFLTTSQPTPKNDDEGVFNKILHYRLLEIAYSLATNDDSEVQQTLPKTHQKVPQVAHLVRLKLITL